MLYFGEPCSKNFVVMHSRIRTNRSIPNMSTRMNCSLLRCGEIAQSRLRRTLVPIGSLGFALFRNGQDACFDKVQQIYTVPLMIIETYEYICMLY
jgi:hypothetical protein